MSKDQVNARAHEFRVRNNCHLSDWELKIAEEFYMMGRQKALDEKFGEDTARDKYIADQLEILHQSTHILGTAVNHLRFGKIKA